MKAELKKEHSMVRYGVALLVFPWMASATIAHASLTDDQAIQRSLAALLAPNNRLDFQVEPGTLVAEQVLRDDLGQTHVRLNQVYGDLPVYAHQLIAHLDSHGRVTYVNGSYAEYLTVIEPMQIPFEAALDIAVMHFLTPFDRLPVPRPIVYLSENGYASPAYEIELTNSTLPAAQIYIVSAFNGEILDTWDNLQTASATGTGITQYSGTVSLTSDSVSGRYQLLDPTRGGLYTTDMNSGSEGTGQIFTDDDNIWGNGTSADRATAGADAHLGAEMTWDFYLYMFGRRGIRNDDKGSLSRVHYLTRENNAYWNNDCFCMSYGDGDGTWFSPLTSLDVAGHEMSHGVTSVTSKLVYKNQSGALNESFSDIMGTSVEFYSQAIGVQTVGDYLIGEDIFTPATAGDALRYMNDPKKDGVSIDHASLYKPGMDVHYSSGVANNVFYLMSEGGKNRTSGETVQTGMGRLKAANIWYRANVFYFTSDTDWARARVATLRAAKDLYGANSSAYAITNQAWKACGVN